MPVAWGSGGLRQHGRRRARRGAGGAKAAGRHGMPGPAMRSRAQRHGGPCRAQAAGHAGAGPCMKGGIPAPGPAPRPRASRRLGGLAMRAHLAHFGGDGEAGGHVEPQVRHLTEVSALAAQLWGVWGGGGGRRWRRWRRAPRASGMSGMARAWRGAGHGQAAWGAHQLLHLLAAIAAGRQRGVGRAGDGWAWSGGNLGKSWCKARGRAHWLMDTCLLPFLKT